MGLVFGSLLLEILCTLTLAIWFMYKYLTKDYNYWKDRGVPYKKAEFPFGSMKNALLGRTFSANEHDNIYKQFPKERFYGLIDFYKPVLVVKDLQLIQDILKKDSYNFIDKETLLFHPKQPMTKHLFNMKGQEWKYKRSILSPTFTSGKLKLMIPSMKRCSELLIDYLNTKIKDETLFNVRDVASRFTVDITASCIFGLDGNALSEENSVFYEVYGKVTKTSTAAYLVLLGITYFPSIVRSSGIQLTPKDKTEFVNKLVQEIVKFRGNNYAKSNYLVDSLMSVKRKKKDLNESKSSTTGLNDDCSEGLTFDEIVAETNLFIGAGFETSASLMSFCLFELCCNQQIQQRLYHEIKEAVDNNGGKMPYETLKDVSYLEQVINETLRLHGSAQSMHRLSSDTYKIPDSDLVIQKGQKVIIPVYSIHHDPQYYPDPYEFNPERFTEEENKKRHFSLYLPFGGGPRFCIGQRFALMQTRIGIASIVFNFHVHLSPDQEVPIEVDTRSIPILPANPIMMKFEKRNIL